MGIKKKNMIIYFMIFCIMVILIPPNSVLAQSAMHEGNEISTEELINEMIDAIDTKDWNTYIDLMCTSEQEYYYNYFNNDNIENGIKQIENISLEKAVEIDLSLASEELLEIEYPILGESNHIVTYIIEVNCKVCKENQYFFNGINYFLIVLAEENGEMKIVQFNRPSSKLLNITMVPLLSRRSIIYEDEMAGINVIQQAENGLIVNAENEIIDDDEFYTIIGYDLGTDFDTELVNPMVGDFPVLGNSSSYSYPSTITVKLDQTGNNAITTVSFDTYMKNTLPNEWMASWHTNALQAGAYCVKMVGWYRKIKPVNSAGGYDVTQLTQMYKPNTSASQTNTAINSISGYGVMNSSGKIFFLEYAAGTAGSAGTQSSGQLKQYGSQYLANVQGYTTVRILNYYYGNSCYSTGDIHYFTY